MWRVVELLAQCLDASLGPPRWEPSDPTNQLPQRSLPLLGLVGDTDMGMEDGIVGLSLFELPED